MAKTSDQLVESATRHQVYLERLKSQLTNSFLAVTEEMIKNTIKLLHSTGTGKLNSMSRKRFQKVLDRIREKQIAYMTEGVAQLLDDLAEIAEYEAGFEQRAIAGVAGTKVLSDKIKSASGSKAFKEALDRPLSANGHLLKPFIKNWTADEIAAVNGMIRKGWAEGWTIQQMTRALRGTRKLRYKDGMIHRVGRHAESMVRTATQHVASTSRMATWEENSDIITGYQWLATLDGNTTQQCRSLDGQVFKVGEGPVPPIHIGCRSTTTPVLDERFNFLDKDATRSSKDGYVNADLSYYEWLKNQPLSFQEDVLGPTRAKLFNKGGLSASEFSRLNLNRRFEPLTLEEMKAKEPKVFERAGVEL